MADDIDRPFTSPDIEIVDEDPPDGWVEAVEIGLADYASGRYVACDLETFDRLLRGAPPRSQAS